MKKFFLSALIIFLLFVVGGIIFYVAYGSNRIKALVADQVFEHVPSLGVSTTTTAVSEAAVLKDFLGFSAPKTYLVLFLNNTEMRPGGGFMGAYAVVQVDKASLALKKVEGTEILDNYAPPFMVEPPAPLKKYLLVDRWNFRDANWSPDFARSSQKSLELYKKEAGLDADKIDAVIGITPTVFEQLLAIIGPITVDGQQYTSANFTEKLEYEVELGYREQGKLARERKVILGDLGAVLAAKVKKDLFVHWADYWKLARRMIEEKQIMVYDAHPAEQEQIRALGWTGEMTSGAGDYVLYADANLGALKTDAAIKRAITYAIAPSTSTPGQWVGEITMRYQHTAKLDWRTSRYRSYARIFVPAGSRLISITGGVPAAPIDQGNEGGRRWFGTVVELPALGEGSLCFRFQLAPAVAEGITSGHYELAVQKQLGTNGVGLTLDLNFGTRVMAATPGEPQDQHGDSRYQYSGDLTIDRAFSVDMKR